MQWLRIVLFFVGLAVFFHWAGGKRSGQIFLGTFGFLLSRPPIVIVGILGTLGMATMFWVGAVDNGNDPLASPALFVGISLVSGLGLAALIVPPIFFAKCMRRAKPELALAEGEVVAKKWPMNHFLNRESRGGFGYLTDRAIHFVPHRFVVQEGNWSLPLEDIASGEVEGGRLLVIKDKAESEHWLILQDPTDMAERLGFRPMAM